MVTNFTNVSIDFLDLDSDTDDDQGLTLSSIETTRKAFLLTSEEDKVSCELGRRQRAQTPADGTPQLFKVFLSLSNDVEVLK